MPPSFPSLGGLGGPPVPPGQVRVPGTTTTVAVDPAKMAPLGSRVAARVVDILLVLLLNVIVNGYFVVQYVQEVWPAADAYAKAITTGKTAPPLELTDQASRLSWIIPLIAMGLWFAYEVPATANSGQTLGKRLLGLRVIRLFDDQMLTFGQSFRRWVVLALPSPLVGSICCLPIELVDLLWCTWDRPAKQCLHDKAVTSVVVRASSTAPKDAPVSPTL